jgi:hypothetical protein
MIPGSFPSSGKRQLKYVLKIFEIIGKLKLNEA